MTRNRNIDQLAPGYINNMAIGNSSSSSGGGGDSSPDPYIYILAGEDVYAGQVLQVRSEIETITTEYIVVNLDSGGQGVVINGVNYAMIWSDFANRFEITISGVVYVVQERYIGSGSDTDYLERFINYEYEATIYKVFIQNSQRWDHNETIGIAVADTVEGDLVQVATNGMVFDYSTVSDSISFEGVQLFCTNNANNINYDTAPNKDDNHLIIVGHIVSNTEVLINITEYINE